MLVKESQYNARRNQMTLRFLTKSKYFILFLSFSFDFEFVGKSF